MRSTKSLVRQLSLAIFVALAASCGTADGWYYPYGYDYDLDLDWDRDDYFWDSRPFGGITVVRQPVYVVDRWTTDAFRYQPYRGYRVRRHNSPVVTYNATKGDRAFEVHLTPLADSTRVEVRARQGRDKWAPNHAKALMNTILKQSK